MLFKNSKFYSFITDIPESIFRTPTFKIYYNIPILAFCWIDFTFPGFKCVHYVIDNKILHIKGSVFVSEALELRAGIAGIRALSFIRVRYLSCRCNHYCYLHMVATGELWPTLVKRVRRYRSAHLYRTRCIEVLKNSTILKLLCVFLNNCESNAIYSLHMFHWNPANSKKKTPQTIRMKRLWVYNITDRPKVSCIWSCTKLSLKYLKCSKLELHIV